MTGRTLIRRISLILAYGFVFTLIAATIIAVADALEATIYDLKTNKSILLACALTMSLVPSAAILFWAGKVVATDFYPLVARSVPIFRDPCSKMITPSAGAQVWICAAFCAAFALAIVVLAVTGTGEKGTGTALHLTGRLSFLLFWPAYAGAATATLFGPRF